VGLPPVLAALAAVIAAVVLLCVWWGIGASQPMWPFPGLYLAEMLLLPVASSIALARGGDGGLHPVWLASGATVTFVLLGLWSIGAFYAPGALLLLVASVSAARTARRSVLPLAGLGLAGLAAQAAIMVAVISMSR
jgi:hypothetical protein